MPRRRDGSRPDGLSRVSRARPWPRSLVVEPHRRVGAEQDLHDRAPGRAVRRCRLPLERGRRIASWNVGRKRSSMASALAARPSLAPAMPSRRVWRAVSSSRSTPSSVEVARMGQAIQASEDLLAHRMVDAGADEGGGRATDLPQSCPLLGRHRPLAFQRVEVRHEPQQCGRTGADAAGGLGEPSLRSRACRRCDAAPAAPAPRRAPGQGYRCRRCAAARARPGARPPAPASARARTAAHSRPRRAALRTDRQHPVVVRARQRSHRSRRQLPDGRHQRRGRAPAAVPRRPVCSRSVGSTIAGRQLDARRYRRPRATGWRRSRAPRRRRSCCGLRPGRAARPRSRRGRSAVTWSTSRARWQRAKQRRPGQASLSGTRRSSKGRIRTRPKRDRARRAAAAPAGHARAPAAGPPAPRRSSVSIRPTTLSSCSSLAPVMSRSSAGRACRPLMRSRPAAARHGRGSPSPSARCASPRAA